MKTTLSQLLAEKMELELSRVIPHNSIETSTSLAQRYGVSRTVMQQALRLLADRGHIVYGRGRPVCRTEKETGDESTISAAPSTSDETEHRRPSSALSHRSQQRTYLLLKDKIIGGEWTKQEPVPKIAYLARRLRVGRNGIIAALHKLQSEELVYRLGRQYFVGSRASLTEHNPFSDKVVCIITSSGRSWEEFQRQKWGLEYVESVLRALSVHKMRLVVCNVYNRRKLDKPDMLKEGYDTIEKKIGPIRDQLMGFMCIFNLYELPNPAWICLVEIFNFLTDYSKPIVWLDSTAEMGGPYPRVRHVTPYFMRYAEKRGPKPMLFRAYPDMNGAPTVVLDVLKAYRHKSIGLVLFRRNVDWMRFRREQLLRLAQNRYPDMKLVSFPGSDPALSIHDNLSPAVFRDRLADYGLKKATQILDEIVETSKSDRFSQLTGFEREYIIMTSILAPVIAQRSISAIIAPHDRIAKRIMAWCESTGIPVPGRLSLVSFDNRFTEQFPHPFSSVDFGFERLGTVSVNVLLGKTAPRRDRLFGITTACTLNHRGSITYPPTE